MKPIFTFSSFIKAFILLGAIGITGLVRAQDPLFTQFYNNPLYYNPATVGLSPGMRMRFNYRDQWPNLPNDFKTYSFSMDLAERSMPGSAGLGLIILNDKAGAGNLQTSSVGLSTGVRVPLKRNMVAQVGITVSFVQKMINYSDLVFSDQFNPLHGNIYQTAFIAPDKSKVTYPDLAVGGVYRFSGTSSSIAGIQGTLGLAVHHIFTPNESFLGLSAPLPRKLVVHGDLVLDINQSSSSLYRRTTNPKSFKFNPGFNYEKQGDFSTYSVGVNVLKSSIYSGIWFRNQTFNFGKSNDLMFALGLYLPYTKVNRMKIMYTYDFILTELRTAAGSAHEVSIVIEFDEFKLFGDGRNMRSSSRGGRSHKEIECTPF